MNEVGRLFLRYKDLKKDKRELFKVYYQNYDGTIDITHLVNKFLSIVELKTVRGEKYILNSSGMGISVYNCLDTKIKLEGNILAHRVEELLKEK